MSRYIKMFQDLQQKKQKAFVPFVVLGDQGREKSVKIMQTLIAAGADALELGIPFTDPLADGPVIQAANNRALSENINTDDCFLLVEEIRKLHAEIPIGILTYANLIHAYNIDKFFENAARVGIDSVLVADVPIRENPDFLQGANKFGVDLVFIAPPNAKDDDIKAIADTSKGYVYMVSRAGVTGVDSGKQKPDVELIKKLRKFNSAPVLLGFGISTPEHVKDAVSVGVDGVISGSAVVKIIEKYSNDFSAMCEKLNNFCVEMKRETL